MASGSPRSREQEIALVDLPGLADHNNVVAAEVDLRVAVRTRDREIGEGCIQRLQVELVGAVLEIVSEVRAPALREYERVHHAVATATVVAVKLIGASAAGEAVRAVAADQRIVARA